MALFGKDKNKHYVEDMTEEEIRKYLDSKTALVPSEQSTKDKVDEPAAMQEKDSDTEDSQTAKARVDESGGAEKAEEPAEIVPETKAVESESALPATEEIQPQGEPEDILQAEGERDEAVSRRIDVLEESISKLSEMLENISGAMDNKAFGVKASPKPEDGEGADPDDTRIMRDYYGGSRYGK